MCLVAFQKIFRKIFSGVWKRRRKTQIRKHKATTQEKKSSTITTQDRDHGAIAIAITERSRSEIVMAPDHDRRRAIAIWIAIAIMGRSRSEIAMAPDRDRRRDRDLTVNRAVGLELELTISDWIFSSCARSLSLSLSLFFQK